jgi:hypothetical protein
MPALAWRNNIKGKFLKILPKYQGQNYTDRAQSRYHFVLKLSYAKLMLCYGNVVLKFINFLNLLIVINFNF